MKKSNKRFGVGCSWQKDEEWTQKRNCGRAYDGITITRPRIKDMRKHEHETPRKRNRKTRSPQLQETCNAQEHMAKDGQIPRLGAVGTPFCGKKARNRQLSWQEKNSYLVSATRFKDCIASSGTLLLHLLFSKSLFRMRNIGITSISKRTKRQRHVIALCGSGSRPRDRYWSFANKVDSASEMQETVGGKDIRP